MAVGDKVCFLEKKSVVRVEELDVIYLKQEECEEKL